MSKVQANVINYSTQSLTFTGYIKHIFKNSIYHLCLLQNFVVLTQRLNDPFPKYVFKIDLSTFFGWKINKKNPSMEIQAFVFLHKEKPKEFFAQSSDLQKLFEQLKARILFGEISEFYNARRMIGSGSSARILLVQTITNKQKFAAKAIQKQYLARSQDGFLSFQNEVKIMKQLSDIDQDSKYFLKIYEVFESAQSYYLIMDLIKGRNLHDEMEILKQKNQQLEFPIIRIIMIQLLRGLNLLHQNGILHRDIKPDNIMFTEVNNFESLKIIDFGLATMKNYTQYLYPKCGTPGYAAPEILNLYDRTEKYDSVCDIFSAGCILYKLLTGHSLFQGARFKEILKANKECHIEQKIKIKGLPQVFQEILIQMLEIDPFQRTNAEQLLEHPLFNENISIRYDIVEKNSEQNEKEHQSNSQNTIRDFSIQQSFDQINANKNDIQLKQNQAEQEIEEIKTTTLKHQEVQLMIIEKQSLEQQEVQEEEIQQNGQNQDQIVANPNHVEEGSDSGNLRNSIKDNDHDHIKDIANQEEKLLIDHSDLYIITPKNQRNQDIQNESIQNLDNLDIQSEQIQQCVDQKGEFETFTITPKQFEQISDCLLQQGTQGQKQKEYIWPSTEDTDEFVMEKKQVLYQSLKLKNPKYLFSPKSDNSGTSQ